MTDFRGPWNYAAPEETEARLRAAGFDEVRCWLQPWPVTPDDPVEFARTVCLGNHLEELPERLRGPYAEEVIRRCGEPLVLEYVRLNIDAGEGPRNDSDNGPVRRLAAPGGTLRTLDIKSMSNVRRDRIRTALGSPLRRLFRSRRVAPGFVLRQPG